MALTDAIRYFTDDTHILASMAIACGTCDQSVQALGGVRDSEGTPITDDTIYDLASLTKLVTGLLTYRLVDEGLLSLSRKVTDYAPQFTMLQGLTVDQILGFEIGLVTPERVDTQPDAHRAQDMLFRIAPKDIGYGRAYSDMHAMVIKYVLETASGMPYMELLRSRIMDPLGLTLYCHVPDTLRSLCSVCDGEHRFEKGKYLVRYGIRPGEPHDPKARTLNLTGEDCPGHAGLFGTLTDIACLARGVLSGKVISDSSLRAMARNRTGRPRPDGGWTQFLGSLCYVKHPVAYNSEVPCYMGNRAIAISGFTGHHLSIDP